MLINNTKSKFVISIILIMSILTALLSFSVKAANIPQNWYYMFIDTTNFVKITTSYSANHLGIDIVSKSSTSISGAKIYSISTSGRVKYIYDYNPAIPSNTGNNSAGNYVVVQDDANNIRAGFMHMRDKCELKVGDITSSSTVLGYVGSTGNSTGPHLHYTVWDSADNWVYAANAVNPVNAHPSINFTY